MPTITWLRNATRQGRQCQVNLILYPLPRFDQIYTDSHRFLVRIFQYYDLLLSKN